MFLYHFPTNICSRWVYEILQKVDCLRQQLSTVITTVYLQHNSTHLTEGVSKVAKKHTKLHTVALKWILADYYLNNHHFLEQKTLHMMDIFTDIFVLSIIKLGHIRLFFFGKSEE